MVGVGVGWGGGWEGGEVGANFFLENQLYRIQMLGIIIYDQAL